VIELSEGEMLADKFWLNPDSKTIWVAENHIKTIVENPVLFEYDGKEELEKEFYSNIKFLNETEIPDISLTDFYSEVSDDLLQKRIKKFESSIYDRGFIWCEYDDKNKILSLRSSSKKFLREGVDDVKEHIDQFEEINLILVLDTGAVIKYRLVGKEEIKLFLDEMIIGRKPSYVNKENAPKKSHKNSSNKKNNKKPKFIEKIKKIINKLYA